MSATDADAFGRCQWCGNLTDSAGCLTLACASHLPPDNNAPREAEASVALDRPGDGAEGARTVSRAAPAVGVEAWVDVNRALRDEAGDPNARLLDQPINGAALRAARQTAERYAFQRRVRSDDDLAGFNLARIYLAALYRHPAPAVTEADPRAELFQWMIDNPQAAAFVAVLTANLQPEGPNLWASVHHAVHVEGASDAANPEYRFVTLTLPEVTEALVGRVHDAVLRDQYGRDAWAEEDAESRAVAMAFCRALVNAAFRAECGNGRDQ